MFVEPYAGTQPVLQVIRDARRSIVLNSYLVTDRTIIRALRHAEKRGVHVRVMLEKHPYHMRHYKVHREYHRIRSTGAAVHWAPSRFRYDHAKYICNGFECEIGTANYSWSAFHKNREYLMLIRNPHIVRAARQVFNADWHHRHAGRFARRYLVLSPHSTRALEQVIDQPGPVDIEQEELGHDRAIMHTLENKGPQVRLILPSSDRRYSGHRIRKLERAGVHVRFMPKRHYMHAKLIAGHHSGFIGSENFSWTSLNKNREMGMLFRGRNLRTAINQFNNDWRIAR